MNKKLLLVITACLLLTTSLAIIPVFSSQPPVNTTTYYNGTIGQPRNVDGALAYDTASAELIFNVLEPLFFFNSKPWLPAETSKVNSSNYADLNSFTPAIAEAMPEVVPGVTAGATWTFKINTTIKYHTWTDHLGVVHSGQTVTAEDVAYHFKWMMIHDSPESPGWMFASPAWGHSYFDWLDADESTRTIEPVGMIGQGEMAAAALIESHIYTIVNGTGEYFVYVFDNNWPLAGLYQTFAQSWGCIEPKAFMIEHGCWNGTFYNGWSTDNRRYPSTAATPMDTHTAHSKYSSSSAEPAMCGTGPFYFNYWDQAGQQWRIDAFANFHAPYTLPSGWQHVTTVIETGVDAWPTRKMMFLSGEFDTVVVPRANMFDLLDSSAADPVHTPLPGIFLYYGALGLQNDVMLLDFNVSGSSQFVPKINGSPAPLFFSDQNIRLAFVQSVNFTAFIAAAWYNEASHPGSWYVEGLPYKNASVENNPWNINTAGVVAALTASGVNSFDITLAYNIGNENRRLFLENMRDNFAAINPAYKVTVVGQDWPSFLTNTHSDQLAGWNVGWLADFADPDNFARTYMRSDGAFSGFQHFELYPNSAYVDNLVDAAAASLDAAPGGFRDLAYQELAWIDKRDAINLPTVQAAGRGWHRNWVRGVYVNQLYPGIYFYDRAKVTVTGLQAVDLDITGSIVCTVAPSPYNATYVYKGQMRIGCTDIGALTGNSGRAYYKFLVHVTRTDANTNVEILSTSVILNRTSGTSWALPNSTTILLGVGGDQAVELTWGETGGGVANYLGTLTGRDWTMGALAACTNTTAYDSNTGNNLIMTGGTYHGFTGLDALGDLNGDGVVDIFDAIILSGHYGELDSAPTWNPDVNLSPVADPGTGLQTIDIFDAIVLSTGFGRHMP